LKSLGDSDSIASPDVEFSNSSSEIGPERCAKCVMVVLVAKWNAYRNLLRSAWWSVLCVRGSKRLLNQM
jgi:hypothetical protein